MVKTRPSLYLLGAQVPTVDVFITACGEDLATIVDTVRAACSIDYPRDKFRVIILDDGNSPPCKRAILALQQQYPNVRYSARGASVKTHSKAANLNHGLEYAAQDGASEMVAVLDVDMIPEPTWLRSMLPHLLQDSQVAIANTTQSFYDLPKRDPVGQLSVSCHMCTMPPIQQDFYDKAWCYGSGFVVRRKALDQMGGFPTECLVEDILTSMQICVAGWKSVYVNESLQWGSIPDSFGKHVKQMKRWTAGNLDLGRALREKKYSVDGALLIETTIAFSILRCILVLSVLPILLLTEGRLILEQDLAEISTLLHLATLDFIMQSLEGFLVSAIADFYISILHDLAHLWMSPYLLSDMLRWFLPRMMGACTQNFKPSGIRGGLEDDEQYHNSVFRRLYVTLWFNSAFVHVIALCVCCAGVANIIAYTLISSKTETFHWMTHAGYPPAVLLWTSIIWNAWMPIAYAIRPPHRSDRETLVCRDPVSEVAYPTAAAKDQEHRKCSEVQWKFMVGYYAAVVLWLRWG